MAIRLEAIAIRLEAIANRVEVIATRVEAIALGWGPLLICKVRCQCLFK